MHTLLAILRHIHRDMYILGPSFVPVALSKYRTEAGWGLIVVCALVAVYDAFGRQWLSTGVWVVAAGLLYAGFETDPLVMAPKTMMIIGVAAIVAALTGVVLAGVEELQSALARNRLERQRFRQVPGGARSRTQEGHGFDR